MNVTSKTPRGCSSGSTKPPHKTVSTSYRPPTRWVNCCSGPLRRRRHRRLRQSSARRRRRCATVDRGANRAPARQKPGPSSPRCRTSSTSQTGSRVAIGGLVTLARSLAGVSLVSAMRRRSAKAHRRKPFGKLPNASWRAHPRAYIEAVAALNRAAASCLHNFGGHDDSSVVRQNAILLLPWFC